MRRDPAWRAGLCVSRATSDGPASQASSARNACITRVNSISRARRRARRGPSKEPTAAYAVVREDRRRARTKVGDVRWPGISGLLGGFDDDTVLAIVLPHPHGDALATGRGQVLADIIRPDRQLAVPTIDQDRELDHARPPEVDQCVERGPDRSARKEHVVDQDDRLALDAEGNVGAADDGS